MDFKTSWTKEIASIFEDIRDGDDLKDARQRARKAMRALNARIEEMSPGPYRDALVELHFRATDAYLGAHHKNRGY